MEGYVKYLKWIGHASFMLEGKGTRVYIDPFNLDGGYKKADVIFITHPHMDHFSINDIVKIADDKTIFVAPQECIEKLKYDNVVAVNPMDNGSAGDISFRAVHSYNTDPTRLSFHQKKSNWVGYIIDYYGTTFYHPGDTDMIDEMKSIEANIALMPIGGNYTMDVDEAIKAASLIRSDTFVPMHYKALLGERSSGEAEKKFLANVKGGILMKEIQTPKYSF